MVADLYLPVIKMMVWHTVHYLHQGLATYGPYAGSGLPPKVIPPTWSLAWEANPLTQIAMRRTGNGRVQHIELEALAPKLSSAQPLPGTQQFRSSARI